MLEARLGELLEEGDATVLTARTLRATLEEEYGVDLSSQKDLVKDAARRHANKLKRERSAAFLSPEMAEVVGVERADRFEVTRLVWQYIKRENLQTKENELVVECDEKLLKVFGCPTVTSFSMARLIEKHVHYQGDAATISPPPPPSLIDQRMVQFCRSQGAADDNVAADAFKVTKIMWAYIKKEKLQDPKNKNRIVFDKTLQDIFLVSESTGYGLSKLVSLHVNSHRGAV